MILDKRLKQRLVGATVLVALAVVIVPELVKEPVEQSRPVVDTTMPPRPTEEPGQRAADVAVPSSTEEAETVDLTEGPVELAEDPAEIELPEIEMTSTKPSADVVFEHPEEPAISPVPEEPVDLPAAPSVELSPPSPPPPSPPPPSSPEQLARIEEKPRDLPQPKPEDKPSKPIELPKLELIAKPEALQAESAPSEPPVTTQPLPATTQPPPASSQPATQADWDWMVQAGSFSREDYANRLRDQLREQGFPASVKRAVIDGQVFYRVRIGPHPTRGESEETLRRLQRVAGSGGRVVHRSEGW